MGLFSWIAEQNGYVIVGKARYDAWKADLLKYQNEIVPELRKQATQQARTISDLNDRIAELTQNSASKEVIDELQIEKDQFSKVKGYINNQLYEAGKTFASLMKAWGWKKENPKAAPSARIKNTADIEKFLTTLGEQLPKLVPHYSDLPKEGEVGEVGALRVVEADRPANT